MENPYSYDYHDPTEGIRRKNGSHIQRGDSAARAIRQIIDEISTMTTSDQVWAYLNSQMHSYIFDQPQCYRSKEQGGGFDWYKVHAIIDNLFNPEYSRVRITALETVYKGFWQ